MEIFFVISGFVIAYSLRDAKITWRYAGNFAFRRSLRLDPPYWATMTLAAAVLWLSNHIRSDRIAPLPTLPQLLAHVLYLQDWLHYPEIVEVFWTLCMEVQFYLTVLLLLGLAQWIGRRARAQVGTVLLVFCVPLTALSIGIQSELVASPNRAAMLKFWYLFQLGALGSWTLTGLVRGRYFLLLAGLLGVMVLYHPTFESAVGLFTGVALCGLGHMKKLHVWLRQAPFQYVGRISYSLYLVHPVVGVPFTGFLFAHFVAAPTPLTSLVFFCLALLASIAAAQALYRLVERPSVLLSRRFKPRVLPSHADYDVPASNPPPLTTQPQVIRTA